MSPFGNSLALKCRLGLLPRRATRVAALLYSSIESARLARLEPRAYLKEAAFRAIQNPGTVTLPTDLKSPAI